MAERLSLPDLLLKLRGPSPGGAADYDEAIRRAELAARRHLRHVRRERQKSQEALDLLREKGPAGLLEAIHLQGLAGYWALLNRSFELRYDDPAQMVDLARLASIFAEGLDPERYGLAQVADFRCQAAIELGNAYRVADQLKEAEDALGEAAERLLEGTGDPLLRARMCDVQASLLADRRRFAAAGEALDTVYQIRLRFGDPHRAGRALISKGLYTNYKGDSDEAIRLIQSGLALIEGDREPDLLFLALHNLARCMVEKGQLRPARILIWTNLKRHGDAIGRVSWLKLRWLSAQIDAGLGKLHQAESSYKEVREGFQKAELRYKEALVTLEMALLASRQSKNNEARRLALDSAETFLALGIRREGLAAILMLQQACKTKTASTGLIESTLEYMTRAEDDPTLSSKAWFDL